MGRESSLEAILAEHSEALFGRSLAASEFAVQPLATGTRRIYRVQPADSSLRAIVAKARSARASDNPRAIVTQTEHEFDVHSAIHAAMAATGVRDHCVPKPLLALPEHGLLLMEEAPGQPVQHWMSRELLSLARESENDLRVRRCGEWLFTFACRARPVHPARRSEADERLLTAGRANHHVYCLIGLTGSRLVETMLGQVRRRLQSYGTDAGTARRIESAFSALFRDFEGARDVQGNVHGKYSIADVLISADRVMAIDLEQAARGSLYLDAGYFLYQLCMITRWRPFGRNRRLSTLRHAFLAGRSPANELDERLLDAFVAYFLVNSLRPGGGLAGVTARARASRWIEDWLDRAEAS